MANHLLQVFLQKQLAELNEQGLQVPIDTLQGSNGPMITVGNRQLINLSSNNYLGLATDERLIEAGVHAMRKYGSGSGAVRTINGTLELHTELEKKLAAFKQTEAAIVYQSGFNCNMAAISAIMDSQDAILSDELNHASIIDGCRLSKARIIRFRHSDMDDLAHKAEEITLSGQFKKSWSLRMGYSPWTATSRSSRISLILPRNIISSLMWMTLMVPAFSAMGPEPSNISTFQMKSIFKSALYLRQSGWSEATSRGVGHSLNG